MFDDKNEQAEVSVEPIQMREVTARVIGVTGLLCNAMSAKAIRDLTIGSRRKTKAEREAQIKHDPEAEFRASIYRMPPGSPTLVGLPGSAWKRAVATAALETPRLARTEVLRRLWIVEHLTPVWGRPVLRMDVVRQAGYTKTPDVRTRAYFPEWCTQITVRYPYPVMSAQAIMTLLANAGLVAGIGDFRQEKGAGSCGAFRLATDDDRALWDRLTSVGGREAQEAALADPEPHDDLSRELLDLVRAERRRRSV